MAECRQCRKPIPDAMLNLSKNALEQYGRLRMRSNLSEWVSNTGPLCPLCLGQVLAGPRKSAAQSASR